MGEDTDSSTSSKSSSSSDSAEQDERNDTAEITETMITPRKRTVAASMFFSASETATAIVKQWQTLFKTHEHLPTEIPTVCMSSEKKATNVNVASSYDDTLEFDKKVEIMDKLKVMKKSTPYCFYIAKVSNILTPKKLLQQFKKPELDYRIQISFFHANTKMFIGRTFKSEPVGRSQIDRVEENDSVKEIAKFKLPVYFHTPAVDDSLVLVLEIVTLVKEFGAVVHEFSAGWTFIKLFHQVNFGRTMDAIKQLKAQEDEIKVKDLTDVNFYVGTPRCLLFMPLDNISSRRHGCTISYAHYTHLGLGKATHLFKQHDIIAESDYIPGITRLPVSETQKRTMLVRPNVDPTSEVKVSNLKLKLPKGFDVRLIAQLEDIRTKEHGEYKNISKSVDVLKRVLRVGVHNACTFLKEPQEVPLVLENDDLIFEGGLNFPYFLNHKLCALVMELQYTMNMPPPLTREQVALLKKKKNAELAAIESKPFPVVVAQYIFFPASHMSRKPMNALMITGPMRAISKNLVYALPAQKEARTIAGIELEFECESVYNAGASDKSSKPKQVKAVKPQARERPKPPPLKLPVSDPPSKQSSPVAQTAPVKTPTFQPAPVRHPSPVKLPTPVTSSPEPIVEAPVPVSPPKEPKPATPKVEAIPSPKHVEPPAAHVEPVKEPEPEPEPEPDPEPEPAPILPEPKQTAPPVVPPISLPAEVIPLPSPSKHEPVIPKMPEDLRSFREASVAPPELDNASVGGLSSRSEYVHIGKSRELDPVHLKALKMKNFGAIHDVFGKVVDESNSMTSTEILQVEDIFIEFLALVSARKEKQYSMPSSLYFTFQFFNFPQTNTGNSPVYLHPISTSDSTYYLLSTSPTNANPTLFGLQLNFSVNSTLIPPHEYEEFKSYLRTKCLFITVFDAERMFKFGHVCVPLKFIIRHELQPSVQVTREFDIVENIEDGFLNDNYAEALARQKGKVHLRLTNVGKKPNATANVVKNEKLKFEQKKDFSLKMTIAKPVFDDKTNMLDILRDIDAPNVKASVESMEMHKKMMALQVARKKKKHESIKDTLQGMITERKMICASYGRMERFSINFSNPYKKQETFIVEINDTTDCLKPICEPLEAEFLTSQFPRDWTCSLSEASTTHRIFKLTIDALRNITLPFKYYSRLQPEDEEKFEMKIEFKNLQQVVMKIVEVRVQKRPAVVTQKLEYFTDGGTPCSKVIPFNNNKFGHLSREKISEKFVIATDNVDACTTVRAEDEGNVLIKLNVPAMPAGKSHDFHVLIYNDKFLHDLSEVWCVSIHFVDSIECTGKIGQTNWIPFKSFGSSTNLLFYSSSEKEVKAAVYDKTGEVMIALRPSHLEKSSALLQVVDALSKSILARVIVNYTGQLPKIYKVYNVSLDAAKGEKMKLPFINSGEERVFVFGTNRPDLLKFAQTRVSIKRDEKYTIFMKFKPYTPCTVELLLFVNDESDMTVQCYQINASYS